MYHWREMCLMVKLSFYKIDCLPVPLGQNLMKYGGDDDDASQAARRQELGGCDNYV